MTTTKVAHRYAKALMELAKEQGNFDDVVEDVRTVEGALAGSPELRHLLHSPVFDDHTKVGILNALFSNKVGPLMSRFIALLTGKGRAADLSAIVDAFARQLDTERHVIRAEITTASPADAEQREHIEGFISEMSGSSVVPNYSVDPSLIGGFKVRYEDRMVDASVRHQLDRLRSALVEGTNN
ncbi:MAG TPA: ATP synthase F1 subunit delta [Candidatus Kapabacteria bacterium]|nr:ATP synthase F1 subunit delta [Candidatus Kapabacteria bacterium]